MQKVVWGASITLAAVVLVGCAAESTEHEPKPLSSPAGDPSPSASLTSTSFEQQVSELRIPAGLSADEYAEKLFTRALSEWYLYGADREYFEAWAAGDETSRTELEAEIVDAGKLLYTNALFIPGWESNPNLVTVVTNLTNANNDGIQTWREAYDWDKSLGAEEWQEGNIVTSVEVLSTDDATGARTFKVTGYQTNNAPDTAAPDHPNAPNNGSPWDFTVTTRVIDDTEYVSDWTD